MKHDPLLCLSRKPRKDVYCMEKDMCLKGCPLKGFATFWEFSFHGQKKVADYEYHSLFAEKIHFQT